ncbi:MAG TPA: ester cyclase [Gemmatimonadota bacterium]|nr:ester cyclase [Gemmatimonadota bacterium]
MKPSTTPSPGLLAAALLLAACGGAPSDDPAVRERNEAVVRALAEALNEHDFAALDTLLTEGYVRHSQATPEYDIDSRDEFVQFARDDVEAFPEAELELERLVSAGDEVAFWGTYRGTQSGVMGVFPPTGEEVELHFSGIHRLEDGRVAETWVTWDNLTALVQLGHWEVQPVSQRPSENAFCAVWITAPPAATPGGEVGQAPMGPAPATVAPIGP